MNALETLREKLKEGNTGIGPSPKGLSLSKEQTSLFFDRTVIPAYLKIADELKAFPVRTFPRKRYYSAQLLVNDDESSFNFRTLIDNESGTLKVFYTYADKNITTYCHPGQTYYYTSTPITRRCKTINLNEYETLTEDRIIEAFADSYLPRKEVAAKIVEEEKNRKIRELRREMVIELICKDCEDKMEEICFPSLKPLFCLFCLFAVLASATAAFAQSTKWRYVMTVPDGAKSYVNDEVRTLRNGNKLAWEKIITPSGSSMVAFTEWDCPSRLRLMRQITRYSADGRTSETGKPAPAWDEIIPESMSDRHYARICLTAPPVKWARITAPRTALRQLPGSDSTTIRVAEQGERFQIVPETEKDDWVNVVDTATERDYWLFYKWFETIEVEQSPTKRSVADAAVKAVPTVRKQKPQKANAQTVKTGKGRKRANR